jgi:hypothetical protein
MADTEQMSLAQKYNLLPGDHRNAASSFEEETLLEFDDYRAFVVSPQPMHREEMLNLLLKSGTHRSFSYSHLYSALFDPEIGIAILFSDHIVNIRGLRLLKGYHRILDRRLVQAAEADAPSSRLIKPPDPCVSSITIHLATPEMLEKFGFASH